MENIYINFMASIPSELKYFQQQSLLSIGLLSIRIAIIIGMTPILYGMPIPARSKLILVISLSFVLANSIAPGKALYMHELGNILVAAIQEAALGVTLALGVMLAFAAFGIAGSLLDTQIGFGIAQIFDPSTNLPSPLLTSAFNFLAVIGFFLVDGHHALLRGLSYSLHVFPIGQPWSLTYTFLPLLKQATGLFSLGFALASPVIFSLLLIELALSVISRSLPQINMLTLGIPVKIIIGLAALSLWITGMGGVMSNIYASIHKTWENIFIAQIEQK